MKYWYVVIEVSIGEYEYLSKSVHKTSGKEEFDLNEYAQGFYGDEGEELDEGVYEFDCGCVIASAHTCEEITKQEYEVLRKYL
jgi:hypothetical protein